MGCHSHTGLTWCCKTVAQDPENRVFLKSSRWGDRSNFGERNHVNVALRSAASRRQPGCADRSRWHVAWLSSCFGLGLTTIFTALEVSATALDKTLLRWRFELHLIGSAVVILVGLFMPGTSVQSARCGGVCSKPQVSELKTLVLR